MDAITSLTKKRLTAMAAGEKIGSDAIAKSLRCYETVVHPLCLERLSVYWDDLSKRSCFEGRTFTYNKDVAGLTGSNMMNALFQSFYDQEPELEVDVIYPRVSRKTSILYSDPETTNMFSEIGGWLNHTEQRTGRDVTSLRQLAEDELGATIVRDLLDNAMNSPLTQGVRRLLFCNSFHFPAHEYVTVASRCINQDLRMKTKYYPSRDDNRAYCSDHNRLRSLVACCLNRMISPKSMATRLNLNTAEVLRPDKKDILDLHLPLANSEEFSTYLILADISNFTGSFANAWLMIFIMGLEVACGKLEDRYQLIAIDGKFLEASWKEMLILYVYLTVGVPCWIEEQSRFGYISGGFLGVGSNITIGLLCLAIILLDLLMRLSPKVLDQLAQAGGDDIAIIIRCSDTSVQGLLDDIAEELEAYVGKLKEFNVHCLEDLPDGAIEGATFCRKRIILSRDTAGIHLTGEPSVPIPKSLFPNTVSRRLNFQIQAWNELDYSLRGFEAKVPGQTILTDTLRQLFLERYRKVQPVRVHSSKCLTGSHRVLRYGTTLITDVAHNEVCEVRSVRYRNITALSSYEAKLRHALITEKVTRVTVYTGEDVLSPIIMTKREQGLLSRTRWVERIHVGFDVDLLAEFLNIVG